MTEISEPYNAADTECYRIGIMNEAYKLELNMIGKESNNSVSYNSK